MGKPIQQTQLDDVELDKIWTYYSVPLEKRFLAEVHSQGIANLHYRVYFDKLTNYLDELKNELLLEYKASFSKRKKATSIVAEVDFKFRKEIEPIFIGLISACTCSFYSKDR